MYFMTLPPGEMQAGRDMRFQAKDAKGLNCLEPSEEDGTMDMWEEIKYVFGYDAEDEADNWWVQWGLLAMRAKGADMRIGPGAFTVQVDQVVN
jgi:salicylate hydroxylase